MNNKKVSFICPGAQKSGTTTLFNMLGQHPSVYLPSQKELYYFNDDRRYKKGSGYYESFYSEAGNDRIWGDITPDYMLFPECSQRIRSYNPDVKLIVMLRNPADRAFSHYLMNKRYTDEGKSFEEALEKESGRLNGQYGRTMKFSYIERGFYYKQLERYYDVFPRENIKIVIFEEFIKNMPGVMAELEDFLGINRFNDYKKPDRINEGYLPKKRWIAYIKRHFVRPVRGLYNKMLPEGLRDKIRDATDEGKLPKELMPEGVGSKLMDIFADDIKALENLIGRDLSLWS